MSEPERLRGNLTPATFPQSLELQGGLGPKAGSFLAEPNRESSQAEPSEAREQGRKLAWEAPHKAL